MYEINFLQLKEFLEQGEAILVDVREPFEYESVHIPGSLSMPLSSVSVDRLPFPRSKIIFYCQSGKRSAVACHHILQQNPDLSVYNLTGGIQAWQSQGFEVLGKKSFFIPLDRQTQLAAGFLNFLGCALGYLVSPYFYGLSCLVACGLMFAGVTGWCGMARVLAKAPWNSSKLI
jgi:rhodanese-related sulfurtransferase